MDTNRQTLFKFSYGDYKGASTKHTVDIFWDKNKNGLYYSHRYQKEEYVDIISVSRLIKNIERVHSCLNDPSSLLYDRNCEIIVDTTPEEIKKLGLSEPCGEELYDEIKDLQSQIDHELPECITKSDVGFEIRLKSSGFGSIAYKFNEVRQNPMQLPDLDEPVAVFVPSDKDSFKNGRWEFNVLRTSEYNIYCNDIELKNYFEVDKNVPGVIKDKIEDIVSSLYPLLIKNVQVKIVRDLTNLHKDNNKDNIYNGPFGFEIETGFFIRTLKLFDVLIEKGYIEYTDDTMTKIRPVGDFKISDDDSEPYDLIEIITEVASAELNRFSASGMMRISEFSWRLASEKGIYLTTDDDNPVIQGTPFLKTLEGYICKFDNPSTILKIGTNLGSGNSMTVEYDSENDRFVVNIEIEGETNTEFIDSTDAKSLFPILMYNMSSPQSELQKDVMLSKELFDYVNKTLMK